MTPLLPTPDHYLFNFLSMTSPEAKRLWRRAVKEHFDCRCVYCGETYELQHPDMKLYQEIILLRSLYKGGWVVENVKSYYEPLIQPQESGSHFFWSNFDIPVMDTRKKVRNDKGYTLAKKMEDKNMFIKDFYDYKGDKRTLLNNAIEGELGLAILNAYKQLDL